MPRHTADRAGVLALCILLLVAFACGGGGSRYGLANLVVQLAAIAVLALRYGAAKQFLRDSPWMLRGLIGLTLLLPLAQVVPLPEHLWSALPGHDLVTRAYDAAGEAGWMTWSVNPWRTALALTATVTPLAVLVGGWTMPRHHLLLVGWMAVALGIVTVLMGLVQLNPAGDNFALFEVREPGEYLLGTFANRNSTGLFLGFCVGLACLLPAPRPHPAVPWLRLALGLLLVAGVVLTKSRTGLALAAIPLGLAALRGIGWLREQRTAARSDRQGGGGAVLGTLGALVLGVAVIGGLFVLAPGRVGETLERFQAKDDPRRFIWEDALFAGERYWPAGAGIGTFDEVFQIDESLENVTLRTAGRAHNDYLELVMEAGLPGLVLAALWLAGCLALAWRARRSQLAWPGWAGGGFLLAIALQSITDYPLRNQTILAFAGLALLLLARAGANRRGEGQ
ncbi:O-antigen ligase family protein [Erythrobacter sp. NE805]|uniref:O-antigen ligase family protein n=1 Tax=Erythrobacter sp. NE805 TaxID=3389875 RepID=UPI00396B1E88